MDYETPDGSQFSLREIWRDEHVHDQNDPCFAYTTISAIVNGEAFYGRLDQRLDDVDDGDVLSSLQVVPTHAIYPKFDSRMLEAPAFDAAKHFLKAPSFTWEDCQPGATFVADCFLTEIKALENLRKHRHPNIVEYHGCVVKDGRVTHICLERCDGNLINHVERDPDNANTGRIIRGLEAGIDFLHSLGLAHNDINPENICITQSKAVIVDFDSCLPFGQRLQKGVSVVRDEEDSPVSAAENDLRGLEAVEAVISNLLLDARRVDEQ